MALNNYSNRPGLLDAAPWSPAGLQAGSGLNRYTNMQPGSVRQPSGPVMGPVMGAAPSPAQQYQPPAMRSLADSLAQYRAQAQAQQPAPVIAAAPIQYGSMSPGSSSSSQPQASGDGGDGWSNGVDSGESIGSQIGNALGITGIGDGAMSGYSIGGPLGAILGGLLGNSVAEDPTNPLGVNAVNGADAGFSMVSDGPGWSGNDGGLADAGLTGVEGFAGMGVPTGEGLGGGLAPSMGGLLGGYSAAPSPAPAPAPQQEPAYTPIIYSGSYNPNGAPGQRYPGDISGYRNSITGEVTTTPPPGAAVTGSAGSGYVPTSTYANPYDTYFSNSSNPYSGYQTYGTSEGE